MDITGIYEQHDMLGGQVLFEFEMESGAPIALDMDVFHEAYDDTHLWVYSQIPLEDTLRDDYWWELVSHGFEYNDVPDTVPADELRQMAENRLEEGNTAGFEARLGH